MQDRRVLAEAYRHGLGYRTVSVESVDAAFRNEQRLLLARENGRILCTTQEVLEEERRIVALAREGLGAVPPLYEQAPTLALDGEQAAALCNLLTGANRVSILRGGAGTGKTTLLRELDCCIAALGKKMVVVAPTSDASRGVLRSEGFAEADTVARLLADAKMQEGVQDGILLVDEAGLLGTKDMLGLLSLAASKGARLILSGDERQHGAVVRGDALRVLSTVAGIKPAQVNKIYRQKNADYREAVECLAAGDVQSAFEKLDAMGAVKEIDPEHPYDELAEDYLSALKRGKSALVICPTHKEGERVTEAIRERLKKAGRVGKKEISAMRYVGLNKTEAEKADWRTYKAGQAVQFGQNAPGIRRGSVWTVDNVAENTITIRSADGETRTLPLDKASRFELYRKTDLPLARGDKVRITRNGFDEDGSRLNNGQLLDVAKVSRSGEIVLHNKHSKATYRLGSDFGHLAHAHCITSHASQGKTVDEVFIAQPAAALPATDLRQFYVSVSRARDKVLIFTDNQLAFCSYIIRVVKYQSVVEQFGQPNLYTWSTASFAEM
jgi:ATP-dependent exoDNAse (exonuclease V) alpha subunit